MGFTPRVSALIVAANFNHENDFELSESELTACHAKDKIFCAPRFTKDIDLIPNCMIDTIYARQNEPNCPMDKIINNETPWKELMAPTSWLYISDLLQYFLMGEGTRYHWNWNGMLLRSILAEVRKVMGISTREILPGNFTNQNNSCFNALNCKDWAAGDHQTNHRDRPKHPTKRRTQPASPPQNTNFLSLRD